MVSKSSIWRTGWFVLAALWAAAWCLVVLDAVVVVWQRQQIYKSANYHELYQALIQHKGLLNALASTSWIAAGVAWLTFIVWAIAFALRIGDRAAIPFIGICTLPVLHILAAPLMWRWARREGGARAIARMTALWSVVMAVYSGRLLFGAYMRLETVSRPANVTFLPGDLRLDHASAKALASNAQPFALATSVWDVFAFTLVAGGVALLTALLTKAHSNRPGSRARGHLD